MREKPSATTARSEKDAMKSQSTDAHRAFVMQIAG
jgi:hypothetical protein